MHLKQRSGFEGGVVKNVVRRVAIKVERLKAIKAKLQGETCAAGAGKLCAGPCMDRRCGAAHGMARLKFAAVLGRVFELAVQDGADMREWAVVVRSAKACLVALANFALESWSLLQA